MTPPLRIGIDARELLGDATGVGRYLGELVRRWATRADLERRELILYAPAPLFLSLPAGVVQQRIVGHGRGTLWEQTALRRAARADRLDVFFAPAYTAPVGLDVPLAVTIHDISFVAHPEWFRWREGIRRRWLTAHASRRAAVVFTDSEFSRQELETRLHVPPGKVRVIAPGVTPRLPASAPPEREPLVLFVGSVFNRRRIPDLLAAFAEVQAAVVPEARLVIVGDNRTWPHQDLAHMARVVGVADTVEFRSYAADDELALLYARASVFVFLSEYEGFGLTPLEALAAGVPIVMLDTPVAREVCGDAATYVQRNDVAGTAAAITRLLTSSEGRAQALAKAPEVLGRYSWERAADETLRHIEWVARP